MEITLDIYDVNTLIYLVEKRIKYFRDIKAKYSGKDCELEDAAIQRLQGIEKELKTKRKQYDDELPF